MVHVITEKYERITIHVVLVLAKKHETRHCIKNNRNRVRVPDSYFFVRTKTACTQTTRKVLFLFDTAYSRIDTPLELVVRS